MIKSVSKWFTRIVTIIMVLIVCAGVILGGLAGFFITRSARPDLSIGLHVLFGALGAFIGFIVCFVIDVLVFGYLTVILDIKNSVKRIERRLCPGQND